MNSPDARDDTLDDGPHQAVVSAADASPLRTTAASSVFTSWMRPGATPPAVDEPAAPQETPQPEPTTTPTTTGEEETMATRKKGAKRARSGGPQLQICSELMQHEGGLTREELGTTFSDLTGAQISSALNNAKSHSRIAWSEKDGVYRLTKAGAEWVQVAAGEAEHAATEKPARAKGRSAAHRRKPQRPQSEELDTSPADEASNFRCAVMSDGAFFITKDEVSIELTADEHHQMLAYLERMAEDTAA